MNHWDYKTKCYVNTEGLIDCIWTKGEVYEVTYSREHHDAYVFSEWDKERRLVQSTMINQNAIDHKQFTMHKKSMKFGRYTPTSKEIYWSKSIINCYK